MKHLLAIAVSLALGVSSATAATTVQTTAPTNLMARPGLAFEKLEALPKGSVLTVDKCRPIWCEVETTAGTKGWVRRSFTTNGADNDR